MPTHMDIPVQRRTEATLRARVERLEAAIRKHKLYFPDEALEGEFELWATLYDN